MSEEESQTGYRLEIHFLHNTLLQIEHHSHSTLQWPFRYHMYLMKSILHFHLFYFHWSQLLDQMVHYGMWNWYRMIQMICNTYRMIEDYPIASLSCSIVSKYFNHTELVGRWNWSMQLITHIFNSQLEFEFTIQMYDITIHILQHIHQSIKSVNHRYSYFFYSIDIIDFRIIHDNCGEWIVVLISDFKSDDRTNDEYTWITWQFRVITITFDP